MFTAGHSGSYTASWALWGDNQAGEHNVDIHLRINGIQIDISRHVVAYSGPSGRVQSQGGFSIILHLDLYCNDCSAGINDTTFCDGLSQFDAV